MRQLSAHLEPSRRDGISHMEIIDLISQGLAPPIEADEIDIDDLVAEFDEPLDD